MASVDVRNASGDTVGTVDLAGDIFGVTPNVPLMHQVVTAQLAGIRSGDHSTLTRAEVRGGGRKPWRQKGSGRARQGSTRAPHWRGGGVAMGPRPRSYAQRTPKKMVAAALRSALSDRAAEGKVVVVDTWDFPAPKTRDAKAALAALGVNGRVLLVLDREQEAAAKSFRNLPKVHLILPSELNAYDVLCSDWVVFTRANLPTGAGGSVADAPVTEAPVTDSAPGTEDAAGRSEPQASDQTSTVPRSAGQPPEAAAR